MSENIPEVASGLRLLNQQHPEPPESLCAFQPPSIGPDGIRTSLEPNPRKAFILHRTAMRFSEVATKWQARLSASQGVLARQAGLILFFDGEVDAALTTPDERTRFG
jgi:hypothetical protein